MDNHRQQATHEPGPTCQELPGPVGTVSARLVVQATRSGLPLRYRSVNYFRAIRDMAVDSVRSAYMTHVKNSFRCSISSRWFVDCIG